MKKLVAISLLSFLFACGGRKPQQNNNAPAAFQEKNVVSSLKSYRSADVVEELYKELMEKDQALNKLNDDINMLYESSEDSLEAYNTYHSNCLNYYTSAEYKITRLGDSVLTKRVRELLATSKAQFEQRVSAHQNVKQHIDTVMARELERVYVLLKIVKTLPVLEKYSKENLPSIKPLQGLDAEYQKTINKVNDVSK